MNILFATDDSELARDALTALIAELENFREPLHVHLLCVEPAIPIADAARRAGKRAVEQYHREEGERHLAWSVDALTRAKVSFTPHIHVGEAAFVILREADELGCQLIAMGTRGRGKFARALLGSTAVRVLRGGHLPVLFPRQP